MGDDSAEAVVAAGKPMALIDQLRAYDGDLKEKIADFLTILEHYRQMSVYTPIHRAAGSIDLYNRVFSVCDGKARR